MTEIGLYKPKVTVPKSKIGEEVLKLCKRYKMSELYAYLRNIYGKNSEINKQ